jgi:hypothetical protein
MSVDHSTVWAPVLEFEETYQASRDGQIRRTPKTPWHPGRLRVLSLNRYGYLMVELSQHGLGTNHLVHRVVYEAFHGRIPPGMQINHRNGIKTDNWIENLEVVTPCGNIHHAMDMGLRRRNPRRRRPLKTES